ncbi:MAG: hypothetical protein K1000chlam4_00527 [Chlamydiae bacterium]|nr:hypothetical protein [Chlamydiota bacterium]
MSSPNQINLDQTQELVSLLQNTEMLKQELSKRVYDTKPVDTISAAKAGGSTSPVAKAGEEVPSLPLPSKSQPKDGLDDPGNLSLVAILGRMLVLLAQSNSTFYSIEWEQGTQMMELSLQMAPIEKDATIQSATLQSEQIMQDAKKEYTMGGFAIAGAGVTLVAGVAGGIKGAAELNKANAEAEALAGKAASDAAAGGLKDALGNPLLEETAAEGASRAASATGGIAKKSFFDMVKFLDEAMRASSMGQVIQGIGNIPAGAIDSTKAAYRLAQGEQDAIVKLGDMLSQYYNQGFNRTSELTQSANQNFNSNIQTFESIIGNYLSGIQKLYQG